MSIDETQHPSVGVVGPGLGNKSAGAYAEIVRKDRAIRTVRLETASIRKIIMMTMIELIFFQLTQEH